MQEEMFITNPVLAGFHPDPCICRANNRYYLITSTFEWLPGISLYESEDLVHWTSKGGLLNDLDLKGIPDSAGIWAPALSYDDGIFYLVYTICKQIDGYFKDVENYVVTAQDIEGPWSEPVLINASGFDPSMFHENGRHFVMNPQWDPRPLPGHSKFNGLLLQEFDFEKGMTGDAKVVYRGSGWGNAEGPHLMKEKDYYYILAAEGGTGRHHSICVARSRNIWGPYEVSPYTPMITAWEKDTILKKSGHGNFVKTPAGEWYVVHLCGRYLDEKDVCVLGRETAIQKVVWEDGWPRLEAGENTPRAEIPAPKNVKRVMRKASCYEIDFTQCTADQLKREEWLSLRAPIETKIQWDGRGLYLRGGDSLTSLFSQSLIARRLESFRSEVETALRFRPYHYNQTAGLTCYYNTKAFYYLYIGFDEKRKQRMINILCNDNFEFSEPLNGDYIYVPDSADEIYLKMHVIQDTVQFFYSFDGTGYAEAGQKLDVSILSDEHVSGWAYTGTVAGITAVDNFNKNTGARFVFYRQANL